ncbi:MAG: outer membrane protein assembly factor BamA [Akkermansia sp.]|nr:outer membrane protein assembly factor BamA [Akkermansia sp.]
MNKPTMHWSAALTALALSFAAPVYGQGTTGDPFLDAMMEDQQEAQQTTKAAAAEDDVFARKPERKAPASVEEAAPVQTRLVSAASDTRLLDEAEVVRELGPTTGLFQNDAAFDGKTVAGVEFRYTGEKVLPDRRLMDVVQTRAGGEYSSVRVNADLERLIERSLVDPDATVAVQPSGSAVKVIFNVRASSVLAGVGFTGNTEFDEDDLREMSKLQPGTVLSDASLARARANIIKSYQEAGYPDTQVSWQAQETASGSYKDVVFNIDEGREVSMNTIDFEGNTAFDDEQLRQLMQTKERGLFTWITKSGRIDREQVEDDLEAVIKHYKNYGYLRARLADVRYTASDNTEGRQKLHLKVAVEEGPRYKVRNVTFGPLTAYTAKELEPGLSMLDGDIYSLQKVADDVTMIRRYYGAKGYADADVRPDINEAGQLEDGTRLIDICYNVNEGDCYKVGRINVRGNTKTRQHVILRELPLKPGENLNSVDLETAKRRLDNLNYFDQVEVSQGLSTTDGYRDINVNVHEKMTGSLTLGVAFSTVENVYMYTTITQSNFDIRGFVNGGTFVGGGQRLTVSAKLGTEYSSASIYLLEPWFLDRKLALGNELFYSDSSYMSDYYEQENYGYAISLRKALSDLTAVKFEYKIEHYGIDTRGWAPIFFEEQAGDYVRSHFRVSYEYDSRDAMITPRKGGHLECFLGYSGPGSTTETYTVGVAGSYYYNSFWDSIFSVNFALETVDTVKSGDDVPIFERCYLGGPSNLRGFRFHDVGMVDEALAGDETMGGNTSAFVQLEMTLPIVESVRFAMFVDAGFVHKNSFDFKLAEWAADYGIGLRINLPMGPLAVDYAIPFKSENCADDGGQFQFYVDYKY